MSGSGSVTDWPQEWPAKKRTISNACTKVLDARRLPSVHQSSLLAVSLDRTEDRERTLLKFAGQVSINYLVRELSSMFKSSSGLCTKVSLGDVFTRRMDGGIRELILRVGQKLTNRIF